MKSLLKRIVRVEDREIPYLLWSFAAFFFLLGGYYLLRPVRDAEGIAKGTENLKWLWSATAAFMLPASIAFAALVSRFSRRQFLSYTFRFFVLNIVAFAACLFGLPEERWYWVGPVFYVWVAVYNLFVVSVFWEFMADLFHREQGKRLFGFISAGGSLGGIAAPLVFRELAPIVGLAPMLILSAIGLESSARCLFRLHRLAGEPPFHAPSPPEGVEAVGVGELLRGTFSGVTLIARSPLLLGICFYIFLYTFGSSALYFFRSQYVFESALTRAERAEIFATFDLGVNLCAFAVQGLLTGHIIRALRLRRSLLVLPTVSTVGFVALASLPIFWVYVVFEALRKATRYALDKPALQAFYTVLSRDEKYKSKNFIDTVVYRGSDVSQAWILGPLIARPVKMLVVTIPVVVCSLPLGYWLGRRQTRYAESGPAATTDAAG